MKTYLLYSVLPGICFALWPIIMKWTGLPKSLAALFLSVFSAVVAGVWLSIYGYGAAKPNLAATVISVAAVAGIINGIGAVMFNQGITLKSVELTRINTVLVVTQVTSLALMAAIFWGEPMAFKKLLGIVFAVAAVICLV